MFTITWKNAGVTLTNIRDTAAKCKSRILALRQVVERRAYTDAASSLVLPYDVSQVRTTQQLARRCRDAALLVVVGIGGSSLGTRAVQEAVLGTITPGMPVLYAETVDSDATAAIAKRIRSTVRDNKRVVINVVSKSGTTMETIANFLVFLDEFRRSKLVTMVVTTDVGSPLEHLAKQNDWSLLTIPDAVGGRYSVFSAVSLFPLAVLGVDIERLVQGAQHMLGHCLRTDIASNPALLLASIAYLELKRGKTVHDTFVFSTKLEGYGKWYRQLLAESLGKTQDAGILPTVSVGSTDLHSVGQYDLAGPRLVFHRFVTVDKFGQDVHVAKADGIFSYLQHKSFTRLLDAIVQGTQDAFSRHKRPFIQIAVPDLSADTIGRLLQMEMVSVMLLGHLLKVNPFDQQAVEEYKITARTLLGR
ncbi:hypothetical protein HY492_03925 [Candidatus Woesearchaeota archaeon]|nr:hypothetical protein [Candidatus Woesearchaeota archaeon]